MRTLLNTPVKTLHLGLIAILTVLTSVATCADFEFTFSDKQTVGTGTQYFTGRCESPQCNVFVAEIDTTNPNIQIVPVTPKGVVRAVPTTMAKENNAIVVVNSSFFSIDTGVAYGYYRKDGVTIRKNDSTPYGVIGIPCRPQNVPIVANITAQETAVRPTSKWKTESILDAVAGGPTLVVNNKIDISSEYTSIAGRNPRTAMGFNANTNKLYMAVIDGRATNSVGMTFEELANFMKGLGCTEAVNYDGGGSSAMIVNNTLMNRPGGKTTQRSVPLCWAVVPCTVIDDTVTSSIRLEGDWQRIESNDLYAKSGVQASGNGTAKAVFETVLPMKASYKVYARWGSTKKASSKVPYAIDYFNDKTTVYKDQSLGKGEWQVLGTFMFSADTPARVTVTNEYANESEFVTVDAVKFELLPPVATVDDED